MKNKLLVLALFSLVVLGGLILWGSTAEAQVSLFPAGCASGLGYSATTGRPCNGTSTATMSVPGCTSALGYSGTNGRPCSGGSVALQSYLMGCTSPRGYSSINGAPCNGTSVAAQVLVPTVINAPGLPTTGFGNTPLYLLLVSGAVAFFGFVYLNKKNQVS